MCKIFKEGIYNFALSGQYLEESRREIMKAAKKGGSFREVIKNYSDSFRDCLYAHLIELSKNMPIDSFEAQIKNSPVPYCNAIFFGKDSDSLFLAMPYFTVKIDTEKKTLQTDSWLAEGDMLPAGHYNNIIKKLVEADTWRGDIPKIIESLIKIEIEANIFEVGGQIHLVKFTNKKGLQWINNKKAPCNY